MKTILFDLDGTLCDSEPGITASLQVAFEAQGYPIPSASTIRRVIGPPFAEGLPSIGVGQEDVDAVISSYREHYQQIGAFLGKVYPGIHELLSALQAKGVVLGVATSKPEASAHPILDYFDLSRYFMMRAGATLDDSRSKKVDVIAHALNATPQSFDAERSNVIMIGDRHHDVEGAAAHSIACVGVTWGYGSAKELSRAGAVTVVDTVAALGVYLNRWLDGQ